MTVGMCKRLTFGGFQSEGFSFMAHLVIAISCDLAFNLCLLPLLFRLPTRLERLHFRWVGGSLPTQTVLAVGSAQELSQLVGNCK